MYFVPRPAIVPKLSPIVNVKLRCSCPIKIVNGTSASQLFPSRMFKDPTVSIRLRCCLECPVVLWDVKCRKGQTGCQDVGIFCIVTTSFDDSNCKVGILRQPSCYCKTSSTSADNEIVKIDCCKRSWHKETCHTLAMRSACGEWQIYEYRLRKSSLALRGCLDTWRHHARVCMLYAGSLQTDSLRS